jgi:serine phosphatase RsbU (regulator of sigma subunit)
MYQPIIRRVPFFARLSTDEINTIASVLQETHIPANTLLFREGEYGSKFYIVIDGRIVIVKGMGTPSEQTLRVASTGDFVGEISLFNRDGLRTASAWVDTEAHVLEMDRTTFENLLQHEPAIAYDMLALLGRRLNESHEKAINDLREKSERLAEAYDELRQAQAQIIEKELIERELLQAYKLQQSMLPTYIPTMERYDLGATMIPAHIIGGDFYDIIPLDDQHVGLAIGDVCGKGIPAAMFMALVCNLLRVEAQLHLSPVKVLQQINRHLRMMNTRGMFVTILYGVLHRTRRTFHYARAGHEPPLLWNQAMQFRPGHLKPGQLLGLLDEPKLDEQRLKLLPGDTLLLYTDGVTEAQNEHNEFFGMDGLTRAIPTLSGNSAQALCEQIVESLHTCCGEVQKIDDITMVALRVLS